MRTSVQHDTFVTNTMAHCVCMHIFAQMWWPVPSPCNVVTGGIAAHTGPPLTQAKGRDGVVPQGQDWRTRQRRSAGVAASVWSGFKIAPGVRGLSFRFDVTRFS